MSKVKFMLRFEINYLYLMKSKISKHCNCFVTGMSRLGAVHWEPVRAGGDVQSHLCPRHVPPGEWLVLTQGNRQGPGVCTECWLRKGTWVDSCISSIYLLYSNQPYSTTQTNQTPVIKIPLRKKYLCLKLNNKTNELPYVQYCTIL